MAGKERADILFCIDASDSMTPCFTAVKDNINKLIDSLANDNQRKWDIRLDFLAHSSGNKLFRTETVNCEAVSSVLYRATSNQESKFFTKDVSTFKQRLGEVETSGDEATLIALDIALDFPWRPAQEGHRVVVLLTDEAIETGEHVEMQISKIEQLVEKIHRKKIKLFIVAPESDAFYTMSMADRCEYTIVTSDNDGLRSVDFRKLMDAIGKSVSTMSTSNIAAADNKTPLFGQDEWGTGSGSLGTEKGGR